jgi:hypothetical protein
MRRLSAAKVAKLAQQSGMDRGEFLTVRDQAAEHLSRGQAAHRRPESSLSEPVDGQADLFADGA